MPTPSVRRPAPQERALFIDPPQRLCLPPPSPLACRPLPATIRAVMRKRLALAFATAACLALAWACGSNTTQPAGMPDAGDDGGSVEAAPLADVPQIPMMDAPVTQCTLADNTDPVRLCTQKGLLAAALHYPYKPANALASPWDSLTALPTAPPSQATPP